MSTPRVFSLIALWVLGSCAPREDVEYFHFSSPDNQLIAEVKAWDEGWELYIYEKGARTETIEFIAQSVVCTSTDMAWTDNRELTLIYEDIEFTYFSTYSSKKVIINLCQTGSDFCVGELDRPFTLSDFCE
jgi:hypothetical protein